MQEFGEGAGVSEAEAQQFKKDNDARAAKAREGMGLPPKEEATGEEPEIEAPAEKEIEPEVAEPEPEEEDSETPEKEEAEPQDPNKSVFRQLNEIRTQKRDAEAREKKTLEEKAVLEAELKTLKANLPPPQPFVDFAKEKGITDPKGVKDMYDLFKGQMEAEIGSKITALETKIDGFQQAENQRVEANAYNESVSKLQDEWSDVLPLIESEYKPTAAQATEAFKLMEDLAHSEQYHDKELDYILYKEAPQFEQILGARKRKTMFPTRGRNNNDGSKPTLKRDGSHESIMELIREQKAKMGAGDGFSVVENGEI